MIDLFVLALGVLFFVLAIAYDAFCDRLLKGSLDD